MSKFFLKITGLCEFVPRYPLKEKPDKNEIRVLLADSKEPPPTPEGRHTSHQGHEPHLARLICPYESVEPGPGWRTEDSSFETQDRKHWAVFYLDDQDLFFFGLDRKSLRIELEDGSECPTKANRCSIRWVAPLALISPGSEEIKKECFSVLNPDPYVISRVALTKGWLHSFEISHDDISKGARLYEFKEFKNPSPGPHYKQALADSVLYETEFDTPLFEVTTTLMRPTTHPKIARMYPEGPGASALTIGLRPKKGEVYAFLKNMTQRDIDSPHTPKPQEPDEHLAHVYRLSKNFGSFKLNVPHPLDYCRDRVDPCSGGMPLPLEIGLVHRGNPNCPPPLAAAYPNEEAWEFD